MRSDNTNHDHNKNTEAVERIFSPAESIEGTYAILPTDDTTLLAPVQGIHYTDPEVEPPANDRQDIDLPISDKNVSGNGEVSVFFLQSSPESVTISPEADHILQLSSNQTKPASTITGLGLDFSTVKPADDEMQKNSTIDRPLKRCKTSPDRDHVELHSIPREGVPTTRANVVGTSL